MEIKVSDKAASFMKQQVDERAYGSSEKPALAVFEHVYRG